MKTTVVGGVIAFIGTLVIVGVALSLAFHSVAIAITPAIVIAGIVGYAVYQIQTKNRPT